MLSHQNIVAQAVQGEKQGDIKGLLWEVDAQLGVLPFFHIYVRLSQRGKSELPYSRSYANIKVFIHVGSGRCFGHYHCYRRQMCRPAQVRP